MTSIHVWDMHFPSLEGKYNICLLMMVTGWFGVLELPLVQFILHLAGIGIKWTVLFSLINLCYQYNIWRVIDLVLTLSIIQYWTKVNVNIWYVSLYSSIQHYFKSIWNWIPGFSCNSWGKLIKTVLFLHIFFIKLHAKLYAK